LYSIDCQVLVAAVGCAALVARHTNVHSWHSYSYSCWGLLQSACAVRR
jgi:hypothetical protein